ncbi:MAG: hypothetical protein AB8B55_24750, partial [Mariniblastus sp.]
MIRNLFKFLSECQNALAPTTPRRQREFSLHMETLEPRQMLSGNVMAMFTGGSLVITGDADHNDLQIQVVEENLVLVGQNDTTINGNADGFVLAENSISFAGNVIAKLKQGNDRLVIEPGAQIEGSILIFAGDGDDAIGLDDVKIGGKTTIFAGGGNDSIVSRNSQLQNGMLASGHGDDTISLQDSQVNGRLKVKSGAGADTVVLQNTTVSGHAHLRTGTGDDDLAIQDATFDKALKSHAGSGDDVTLVRDSSIGGHSLFLMQTGDDA